MAKHDASKVSVGKPVGGGAVYAAPIDTVSSKIPKDARAQLDPAFKALGYVSEDGLTNGIETDTESITAWGGDTVLTVATSRSESFSLTLIQVLDIDVLKEVYGPDNVTDSSGALTVKHSGAPLPARVWAFDIALTSGQIKRIVVPHGRISEVGDTVYKDDEAIGYEVTISCAPDEHGVTAYEYIAAPAGAGVGG